jgi:23S rRNA G2445 N2-methylase RlmL
MPPPVLDCYAITPPGVEVLTAGELGALGLSPGATERGGVSLRTDLHGVAVGNLELRTASRRSPDLQDLCARFGQVLRRRCPGWGVSFLSARAELATHIGLDLVSALSTTNGGIRVRLRGTVPAAA